MLVNAQVDIEAAMLATMFLHLTQSYALLRIPPNKRCIATPIHFGSVCPSLIRKRRSAGGPAAPAEAPHAAAALRT